MNKLLHGFANIPPERGVAEHYQKDDIHIWRTARSDWIRAVRDNGAFVGRVKSKNIKTLMTNGR